MYGFVASAGGSVGLLAGGVLTQAINWHWIFFINVPIGLRDGASPRCACSTTVARLGLGEGADLPGAALIVGSLMLGVYTIVSPAAEHGWGSATTLAFAAGSLVLLALFVWREATARQPLMPLRVFRSRDIVGANAIQALLVAGMFGTFFLGSLYLQRVLRLRPAEDRPRLPADDDRDGHAVAALLRTADHALRRAAHAAAGDGAGRGRPVAVRAHPRARQLRRPTCCR